MVENDPERVEADLAAGRLVCPLCGGALARWGVCNYNGVTVNLQ